MTLPAYRNYQTTPLNWASSIPLGWKISPLKHVCTFSTGWTPPSGNAEAYVGDNLWANISDIGPRILNDTAKRLSDEAVRFHGLTPSPVGSLLFSFKLSIGQVSFVGREMYTNEAIATFLHSESINLSFAYYAFPEMITLNASENIYGAKMLNRQLIQSARLVLPPPSEQKAIVNFLDRETGKIDALVSEQQRLIALLKEKRGAVISHAVTQGLNPDAPMKDSGVEWFGEVPEHWEVSSLKRHWSVTDCKHITAEFFGDGVPVASIREAQSKFVDLESANLTTDAYYEQLIEGGRKPQPGDLIFTRNATVGEVAQVTDWHPPFALGQDVCLLRKSRPELSSAFLQQVIWSDVIARQLGKLMIGSTFKRVNVEEIRNLKIPVPNTIEQAAIAVFLDGAIEGIDRLVVEAEVAIGLLQERRTALIFAAVTGKIDVRGTIEAHTTLPDVVAA